MNDLLELIITLTKTYLNTPQISKINNSTSENTAREEDFQARERLGVGGGGGDKTETGTRLSWTRGNTKIPIS